jgi:transglutaminase-like putative cysteine protease
MQIRYGYSIELVCDTATPVIAMLDVHPSGRDAILEPDSCKAVALVDGVWVNGDDMFFDAFGNLCRRIVAPAGGVRLEAHGRIRDSGFPDPVHPELLAAAPGELPADTLEYLWGSRYCETDRLTPVAWANFGHMQTGWSMVQAICDFVHHRIRFDYSFARPTRTALDAYEEQVGVCRDFAHLAIALCRSMNIPARYCTGYLGDIGVPRDPAPMDFSAWFEVYLGGRWFTFDARHNTPRIGRIVIGRGRDATDVPILNSFGLHQLMRFEVITEEVPARNSYPPAAHREFEAPNARLQGIAQ